MRTRPSISIACLTAGLFILSISLPADARTRASRKKVRIRNIDIDVKNVFDPNAPGENYWPFRVANFLHIRTHARVVREALLFEPGDTVLESRLEESERNLRALSFIKDARISEIPVSRTEADILVRTQDAWTLQPQVNFGSEGGQNHSSAGILEENLFGYGKAFSYFYRNDPDGVTHQFAYEDPQLFYTRGTLKTLFEDTPTGNHQAVSLARPFYSLETAAAGGIDFDHSIGLQKIFQNGNQTTGYDQRHLDIQPNGGVRLNQDPLNVQRLVLRYRYTEDIFLANAATTPGTLPENRALSGPILTWSLQQSDFIKETFVNTAERIEDFNLGHQTSIGTGYYSTAFGATHNSMPITALDAFGFGPDEGPWFGQVSYGVSGRYNLYDSDQTGGRLFNSLYFGNLNLYRHWLQDFPFTGVMHMEMAHLQNPDTSNQLSLGGNTGLRGYKVDSFTGNKTVMMNLENRFFYPYEVLHLAYIGGAMFADAGEAEPQGTGFHARDFHADVGVGLRFALTRSTEGTVYRIDLAYAIGPIQQDKRWILSISSGVGFKSNGNTYSNFTDVPTQ